MRAAVGDACLAREASTSVAHEPTFVCGACLRLRCHTQAAWKARPVSLNIPANTKPTRIVLEGTPLLKGMLVLTGCRWVAAGCFVWLVMPVLQYAA